MKLTQDQMLEYQGLNGMDGICRVRVYRSLGRTPVVIAGQLDDSPGTYISNAIEMVAEALKREPLPRWRSFKLIQHYPTSRTSRSPSFSLIKFRRRAAADPRRTTPAS